MARIGILGSGDVGRTLGTGFAKHGWEVMLGSRSPDGENVQAWASETGGKAGTFAEAAAFGEVVVVATLGTAAQQAVELAGVEAFAGKLVLDATNPLDFSQGMPPTLAWGTTESNGERLQAQLPEASVVKCFNTVGHVRMVDPDFSEGTPPMLICGNDEDAKKRTEAILVELGWPGAIDAGDIAGARWLEAMVPLWVRVGATLDAWDHGWKVVR